MELEFSHCALIYENTGDVLLEFNHWGKHEAFGFENRVLSFAASIYLGGGGIVEVYE